MTDQVMEEYAPVVEMFLDDAQKQQILGIPNKNKSSKPVNLFFHATELDKAGRFQDAEPIYLELLNANFDNPVLHAALGMNYAATGRNGLAATLLKRALEGKDRMLESFHTLGIIPKCDTEKDKDSFHRTKHSEMLNALGTCYKHENRVPEARALFNEAQSYVNPNADILNNIGTLSINEGEPTEALRILSQAIDINPNHPQAHWNRSLAYLELGDYPNGWKEYDYGFAANVRIDRNYTRIPLPQWNGEKNANVIVFGEQGIGDEILFASMLPELIRDTNSVVFDCHKKLHTLFCSSFPSIDIYPTREDQTLSWPVNKDGSMRYPFTHKIAIGSLGKFYRNSLESFPGEPYITPTQASIDKWAAKLASLPRRPNIGISWIGGHKRTRMEVRSIPLAQLKPILADRDVNWISLQYTPCEDEIEEFTSKTGIKIHHWPDACYNADYDQTAGLVKNLDLIITVATSVIHLAGSMGVPTWVLTASRAAWREYYGGDTNPWYKSLTMFRQDHGSIEWDKPITEVAETLTDMLSAIVKES